MNCRKCGVKLSDKTWSKSRKKYGDRICRKCHTSASARQWHRKPTRYRTLIRERYKKLKLEVLSNYSVGRLGCVRCSFSDIRALSLDHINGGGTKRRRETGRTSRSLYAWLKRSGFPPGYQTLCMNCQFVKRSENKELGGKPKKWVER